MIDETLTKRQHEILERLEQDTPVKKIATDLGVSRNAVYLQIERLRERGVLPRDYTPSGQPPRTQPPAAMSGLELGAAVPAPGFRTGLVHRDALGAGRASAAAKDSMPAGDYARDDRSRRGSKRRRRARLRARPARRNRGRRARDRVGRVGARATRTPPFVEVMDNRTVVTREGEISR